MRKTAPGRNGGVAVHEIGDGELAYLAVLEELSDPKGEDIHRQFGPVHRHCPPCAGVNPLLKVKHCQRGVEGVF